MKINFIDLQAQYQAYKTEIDAAVSDVLTSAKFIMGPPIKALEEDLKHYTGAPHALTCASGTDALLLALMAIDIKPGDEVITTPFTFISTATMIRLLGAKPIFVDIDEQTYNLDPAQLAEKITDKTRAIIAVSLYGQVADIDEIVDVAQAQKQKIYVIEDAAQSFGAEYKGKKSCNLADMGASSFFPSKPLGCYGDGGALMVQDEALAAKVAALRVHGQTKRYYHEYLGINGRMDTLQAAIVQVKLKHFDEELKARQQIADRYAELLSDLDVTVPFVKSDRTSVYGQYSARVNNRDSVLAHLKEKGVPTAVHYPKPLHLQPCFADLGGKVGDFPVAEKTSNEIFSLPMSAFLKEEEQDAVLSALKEALSIAHTVA